MAIDRSPSSEDSQLFLAKDGDSKLQTLQQNTNESLVQPTSGTKTTWKQRAHKYWLYEAWACVWSILLFVAIIILLSSYDGKEYGTVDTFQSSSMKQPALFSYLSLMSTVMKAAMLLPVATSISQLTWNWFKSHRRLIDIERFDEASRGMLGSLQLLWSIKLSHWVGLGAAIMLLALPMDAFIQSSVLLPQRLQPSTRTYPALNNQNTTTLPIATYYNDSQTFDSSINMYASTGMIDSVITGIVWLKVQRSLFTGGSPGSCPSGYCEFGVYQTLGITSQCVDRSKDIIIIPGGQNKTYLTLPGADGLQLVNNFDDGYVAVKSYDTPSTVPVDADSGPLLTRTAMIINTWDNDTALAMECSLYWVVKSMTAYANRSSTGEILESEPTNLQATHYEANPETSDNATAFRLWPGTGCYYNNHTVTQSKDPDLYAKHCVYGVSKASHKGIQRFIMEDQDGFHGVSEFLGDNNATNESTWSVTNNYINNIYDFSYDNRNQSKLYVEIMHFTIALFMTRHVRVQGGIPNEDNTELYAGFVTGKMSEAAFYYKIAWVRLIYPAVIVLASAIFVLVTALKAKRDLQWRRSNVPMMFHGLSEVERDTCRFEPDLLKMEHAATNMQVKLVDGHEGVRLTGFRREQSLDGMQLRSRTLVP